MTAIIHLIQYMKGVAKKTYHLFCDRCEHQFTKELPIDFPVKDVVCPNCQTDGFIIGHRKRDR